MTSEPHQPSGQATCCHHREPDHASAAPARAAKYFCPMCDGVVADKPGACPMCGMALERNPAYVETASVGFTCPMHPEIHQDQPGACPICGMALEPVQTGADDDDNAELHDMVRRFWTGVALAVPILVLSMGADIPGLRDVIVPIGRTASVWAQFVLSSPVVLWAGWPFFERGGRSLVTRHLNMFTLIALGTGAAYFYSVVATIAPGLFPRRVSHARGG